MGTDKMVPKPGPALQTHAKRLCNIASKSCDVKWTSQDVLKLQPLDMQLDKILKEYESILNSKSKSQAAAGRVGKPSFSRSSFYHTQQPWDKSHSFRLAPPPVTNASNSKINTSQKSPQVDARLLLSNLPLLQNLRNLQHLNNNTDKHDS